ncbi:penicillin-binding protein 2 [Candidatus Uhrbacteria bacterium]|nr:penicillin-binding protein 2 [Candidatus Uhrbacteria bacterium]
MTPFRKKYSSRRHKERGSFHFDRITFCRCILFVVLSILIARMFTLQVLGYANYKAAADGEHQFFQKIYPERGSIYLRERDDSSGIGKYLIDLEGEKLFPAVTNRDYKLVYAVPKSIADPVKVAEQLAPLLEMETQPLLEKLQKKNDSYEVLKHKVTDDAWSTMKKLKIGGINATSETFRFYPEKGLGGHIFGFVGHAGDAVKGLYGLEGYFDDILRGKEGSLMRETDALGALIPLGDKRSVEAVDGSSLVLTVDRVVQLMACDRLKKWVLLHGADGGSIVILDPKTGALIAMCSVPDFDPEEYSKADISSYNNPALFTPYEPGSIFKPFTMAMGLDSEKVSPATTYDDTGEVKIGSFTIKNSDLKANGRQNMMDVLDKSLNTGVIFVARKVGLEKFYEYVKKFGFGTQSGIEMDKEVEGNISSLKEKQEIYMATASFGQGITATPLQIATAFGALANGGKLMQPYIVDEIIKPDGTRIHTQQKVLRQVVSARTASLIGGMLVNVVRKGHGKRAGVDGYYVAGKTGTAQVARKDGRGYERNDTIGSFAGFAPVDNPRFVMLVKIDHPRDVQWAESSAAPLFGELAKFMLQYFEIPPDETESRSKN